jgi:hypothetical protein
MSFRREGRRSFRFQPSAARRIDRDHSLCAAATEIGRVTSDAKNFFWSPARRIWIDKDAVNTGA